MSGEAPRGVRQCKPKFVAGEKVLCYEPDPNKVKILYDAKILEVQNAVGPTGKRRAEFLVHFQGWNSSWDRYVLEDMLVKDGPEGKALQDKLNEEKPEQERLAKKLLKKKKMERSQSDRSGSRLSTDGESVASTGDGSVDVTNLEDPDDAVITFKHEVKEESEAPLSDAETDTQTEPSHSPDTKLTIEESLDVNDEEEEELCHEVASLVLSEGMKRKLELDHAMVNKRRKLVHLPAQPNIVKLLEIYVKNFAIQKLAQLEKQINRNQYGVRLTAEKEAEKYEDAVTAIDLCKEVAEGVRIVCDFQLGKLLLYPTELQQFEQSRDVKPTLDRDEAQAESARGGSVKQEEGGGGRKRKSTGRSLGPGEEVPASLGSCSSGTGTPTLGVGVQYPTSTKSHKVLAQYVNSWKLVPESLYFQEPVPSSLVYGGIHLARLLVKLPEILAKMKFTVMNAKNIHKYLELLETFLASQPDIFSEDNYK